MLATRALLAFFFHGVLHIGESEVLVSSSSSKQCQVKKCDCEELLFTFTTQSFSACIVVKEIN